MAVAFQKTGFQSSGFQETSAAAAPAFQSNAFQSTTGHVAFQTTVSTPPATGGGGYLGNFDVNNTFSQKRKKPQEDLTRRIRQREELRSDLDRAVAIAEGAIEELSELPLEKAAPAAEQAIKHVEYLGVDPELIRQLRLDFQMAYEAAQAAEARRLFEEARAFEEDEDEAITMLLLH